MRTLIITAAMAALAAGQAPAQTPPAVETGAEALTPELFTANEPAPPVQIAALGNPPPHPVERPLAPAPAIEPAALPTPAASAASAADVGQDAAAREPILDLTATPD